MARPPPDGDPRHCIIRPAVISELLDSLRDCHQLTNNIIRRSQAFLLSINHSPGHHHQHHHHPAKQQHPENQNQKHHHHSYSQSQPNHSPVSNPRKRYSPILQLSSDSPHRHPKLKRPSPYSSSAFPPSHHLQIHPHRSPSLIIPPQLPSSPPDNIPLRSLADPESPDLNPSTPLIIPSRSCLASIQLEPDENFFAPSSIPSPPSFITIPLQSPPIITSPTSSTPSLPAPLFPKSSLAFPTCPSQFCPDPSIDQELDMDLSDPSSPQRPPQSLEAIESPNPLEILTHQDSEPRRPLASHFPHKSLSTPTLERSPESYSRSSSSISFQDPTLLSAPAEHLLIHIQSSPESSPPAIIRDGPDYFGSSSYISNHSNLKNSSSQPPPSYTTENQISSSRHLNSPEPNELDQTQVDDDDDDDDHTAPRWALGITGTLPQLEPLREELTLAIETYITFWPTRILVTRLIQFNFYYQDHYKLGSDTWLPISTNELRESLESTDPGQILQIVGFCHKKCCNFSQVLDQMASRNVIHLSGRKHNRMIQLGKDYTPLGLLFRYINSTSKDFEQT